MRAPPWCTENDEAKRAAASATARGRFFQDPLLVAFGKLIRASQTEERFGVGVMIDPHRVIAGPHQALDPNASITRRSWEVRSRYGNGSRDSRGACPHLTATLGYFHRLEAGR